MNDNLRALPNIPIETPGFTRDVLPYYKRAFITVVVDADETTPLCLATKATETMLASQRVLFITPPGSPARAAFDGGFASVRFSSHDPGEVAASLRALTAVDSETVAAEMAAREKLLLPFRPHSVASAFTDYAQACLLRPAGVKAVR